MKLALNYSRAAAELVRSGRIGLDYFKCPAWPDVVSEAASILPTFVHFPLEVGLGIGDAMDGETGQRADWSKVERLLASTETRHVNLHLSTKRAWFPEVELGSTERADVERVTGHLIRDVQAVVERFGRERVIVENDYASVGTVLRAAYLTETIERVVSETGCGLLLDLAHAQIAARDLGLDAQAYVRALPVERLNELHVSGIRRLAGRWLAAARRIAPDDELVRQYAGQPIDHLPMTRRDWRFMAWALGEVRRGVWSQPWATTFEYGGVSWLFLAVTDAGVLAEQVERLCTLAAGVSACYSSR